MHNKNIGLKKMEKKILKYTSGWRSSRVINVDEIILHIQCIYIYIAVQCCCKVHSSHCPTNKPLCLVFKSNISDDIIQSRKLC